MKHKCMVLGLTVALILVLSAALAGPANATPDKWTPFQATFVVDWSKYVPPTLWPTWKGEDPYTPAEPFVPVRTINEIYEGAWQSSDPAIDGYAVTHTNGTATYQGAFEGDRSTPVTFTLRYVNKTTVDVPGYGRWQITASGLYRVNFLTGSETHTLVGQGHGVSGVVKGWVMKFTADFAAGDVVSGYYMEK